MAALRALDRKLTDGLNLVHGQFAVRRTERQEDREELREFRRQHREDLRELETRIDERFAVVDARLDRLENALLGLTAQINKLLERSSGTRRLVWGVLGAVGLLFAGALARPLFDRVAAVMVGG